MQQLFKGPSGVLFLPVTIQETATSALVSSTIRWINLEDEKRLKVLFVGSTHSSGSKKKTFLTFDNLMDENSFQIEKLQIKIVALI